MKIWTRWQKNAELDDVEVSAQFWGSEFGRVAGERGYDLDIMLNRFLACRYEMVLCSTRHYEALRATVMHNWPKEWR